MLSDSVSLNYTFPWVRPPVEIYSKVPVRWQDGVDFGYHQSIGPVQLNLGGVYSIPFEHDNANASHSDAEAAKILTLTAEYKNWQFGIRRGETKIKITTPGSDTLFGAFNTIGTTLLNTGNPAAAQEAFDIADQYHDEKQKSTYVSIGATYDSDTFLFMAEHLKFTASKLLLGDSKAWYMTFGYHIKEFTPYINFARTYSTSTPRDTGVSVNGIANPAIRGGVTALNTGLNTVLSTIRNQRQKSMSLGIRWDPKVNMDVKLQFDRFFLNEGSNGLFTNASPNFRPGSQINLITATVDFVF
jgi:hypothetical protein